MFRRLHLDEASRAALVRPPTKEGENKEDQGESDLALEFSRLLEQVQGPVAATHDEVMALGLALAQAIPAVQQARQETARQGDSGPDFEQETESGEEWSDKGFDTRSAVSQDDRSDAGGGMSQQNSVEQVRREDCDSAQGTNSAVRENPMDDGSAEEATTGLQLQLADESLAVGELADASSCSAGQVEAEAHADVKVDTQVVVQQQVTSAEITTDAHQAVEASLLDLGPKKAVSDGGHELESQEPEENADDSGDFATTADILGNHNDAQDLRARRGSTTSAGGQHEEQPLDSKQGQLAQSSQPSAAEKLDARPVRGQVGEGSGAHDLRAPKQLEASPRLAQHSRSNFEVSGEAETTVVGRKADVFGDVGLQMTLLRQAFEGLRLQRQEGGESKQKGAGIQAVAGTATADMRPASHELGGRASKPLSRGAAQRMLERVEATLKEAARSRDGKTISVRLDPAQLGRVKVDVSLREGALHARITPENQQVLVALRDHAHELQGALRKLGLNVDSVTVTVSADAGQEASEFGRELKDGKSYQDARNNMPGEGAQVPEGPFGSEIAELGAPGQPRSESAISDHWIA